MAEQNRTDQGAPEDHARRFWIGIARAFGGAIIFALPMFMTMEMWELGFYMDRLRLALLLIALFPLLVGLSYFVGFEDTFSWRDDVRDALVAYAVGFIASGAILALLAIVQLGMSIDEIIGKVGLQVVPASLGAMLARSQLGGDRQVEEEREAKASYGGEMFICAVGALFLAFNVAPTEEMVLIAYKMSEWHALALAITSLLSMHGFVYALEFSGQPRLRPGTTGLGIFLRMTVVGYVIALLISLYVLWSFGRIDGTGVEEIVKTMIVLGFPAAIGAAAARLII